MQTERDQSEFNDVIAKLRRMDECFQQCNFSRIEKNLELWIQALASLFSELITAMTDIEINDWNKKLKDLIDACHKTYKENSIYNGIPKDLYWKAMDFEFFIRSVYKKAGYEGKKKHTEFSGDDWD